MTEQIFIQVPMSLI